MTELWEEWEEYNYHGWNNQVADLYHSVFDKMGTDAGWGDPTAQMYFDVAFFSDETMDVRSAAREFLVDYLKDQYDIDFSEEFDWEGFREWYDANA